MDPLLMIHGGAGALRNISGDRETAYRTGLESAVRVGIESLSASGSALDAVETAVRRMEDDGQFNAGRGSVLNFEGNIEVDAAIMSGDRQVGAVGACPGIVHPVSLARHIMEETDHILISGAGAKILADKKGLESIERPYPGRLERFQELKQTDAPETGSDTVGALAIDERGRVAAAVSTGGLWLKLPGRIGDSPLIGSGFFALNGVGAAVATGKGEAIMRTVLCLYAVDVMAKGASATTAAQQAIDFLTEAEGEGTGGLIVIDAEGRPGAAFNTRGMGHAWATLNEPVMTSIWPE